MEIKKCPCCGSVAHLIRENHYQWFGVQCLNERCNIRTPLCSTEIMAIHIWNNRYTEATAIDISNNRCYIEQSQNERVKYALKCLEENGFEARCVNDAQGLIHCYDRDGELVCYYATTGKIQGSDKKGILRLLDRLRGYNG